MQQKLLIIDDEVDACALMKEYFIKKDFQVDCAYTLQDGVDKINESEPNVLFLDHNLPDGLGWGIAARIKKAYPEMRIILLTAFDAPPYPLSGSDPEFTKLEKPVNFSALDKVLSVNKTP
jgi:DNA-binding response OmpR family regulator